MDLTERVERLSKVALFSGLTRPALEMIAKIATEESHSLGTIVFVDPAALRDLEEILHPKVRDAVRARLAELQEGEIPVAVIEVIKLLESPLHDRCDTIWVVRCEETDAVTRLAASRGMSEADARARLANQSSQEDKVRAADTVIDGSAPIDETRRQVREAYERFVGDRAGEQEAPPGQPG